MTKILIIRFSSIGDIVLTTPVVRCVKTQLKDAEVHFVTKKQYVSILKANPYIDKIYSIEKGLKEILPQLKQEKYDYIIDLHKNLRTLTLKLRLKGIKRSFQKLNIQKWLLVRMNINLLPKVHIVDRYMETVIFIGVKNDGNGLDYFIPADEEVSMNDLPVIQREGYAGVVIGSIHETKQMPVDKLIAMCRKIAKPVVLLGGPEDKEKGDMIVKAIGERIYNSCGKFTINRSASLVRQADSILTNDTGLMHIAAAFKRNIVSVWGNTVPEFGMFPYLAENPQNKSVIIEVKGLSCRPCSKLGFEKCPKGHFNCMMMIDESTIAEIINNG